MRTREYAGCAVQTDDEGFLLDGSQWTPDVGEEIAREAGIWPLTEEHWSVITFCREDAAREGRPPGLRRIAKHTGVRMKSLHRLFGNGARLAVRIAGLPKGPDAPGRTRNLGDGFLRQESRSTDRFHPTTYTN
jgi:dissimilatory sulfite reductase related protein